MNLALRIVLGAGIVLGIIWTVLAAMAQGAGGLGVFAVFLVLYALYAVFMLFAAWAYWKHPGQRRVAGWIMALPIVFWFLPLMIRSMSGGVLTNHQLAGFLFVATVAALAVCWVAPRKAVVVVPDFLLRSRLFNWLILLSMITGWLFMVLVLFYVANSDQPRSSTSGTGEGLAMAIILGALYLVWLGVGSFGASTWAWLSLRGGTQVRARKLNIAQLVVAAPGILIAIAVSVWLLGQGRL